MKISLDQVSGILNRTPDEVLYIANNEQRLSATVKPDNDIVYKDDGTVEFVEGEKEQSWEFDIEEVLAFKKKMDEGLAGELQELLTEDSGLAEM